jgi:hypothetical protein
MHGILRRGILAVVLSGIAAPAVADETDNFTCRLRQLADSAVVLDEIMNARLLAVVERANRAPCDDDCLVRLLHEEIGGSYRHPMTLVPHARFERWVEARRDVARCRTSFRDSIYGARPYNQPWLLPFTGRVILLADSIRLSGRVVGIDKLNHFVREGLAHWRDVHRNGRSIDEVLAKELGAPGGPWAWNEFGVKGWSLTGVLSYADLAAGYAGFRFWSDLSDVRGGAGFVSRDAETGRFVLQRRFAFSSYVTDAWDEGVNCSVFRPGLAREVAAALARRSMSCPVGDTASLAALPDARLYVNPAVREGTGTPRHGSDRTLATFPESPCVDVPAASEPPLETADSIRADFALRSSAGSATRLPDSSSVGGLRGGPASKSALLSSRFRSAPSRRSDSPLYVNTSALRD